MALFEISVVRGGFDTMLSIGARCGVSDCGAIGQQGIRCCRGANRYPASARHVLPDGGILLRSARLEPVLVRGSISQLPLGAILEPAGAILTVVTPLVAVPLTVITFYLKALREHQVTWHAQLSRRVETFEATALELRRMLSSVERDYTTKEEWLRECMQTRRALEHLNEATVRLETLVGAYGRGDRPDEQARAAGFGALHAISPSQARRAPIQEGPARDG